MRESNEASAVSEADIDAAWDLLDADPPSSAGDDQPDDMQEIDAGWDGPEPAFPKRKKGKPPKRGPRNAENRAARVARKAAERAAKRAAAQAKNRAVNAPKPPHEARARVEPKARPAPAAVHERAAAREAAAVDARTAVDARVAAPPKAKTRATTSPKKAARLRAERPSTALGPREAPAKGGRGTILFLAALAAAAVLLWLLLR